MFETNDPENSSFISQLKRVVEDGISYAQSQINLLQTQIAALALSSLLFVVLILLALAAGVIAFVLLSVAFGLWLAHVTGSAGWSLLIIGGIYAVIAAGLGGYAIRWLKNLKS